MPDQRSTEPRKRRTREHVIADLAVHHVEGHILRCGFTMKRIGPDYGLDLALATYSARGAVEPGLVWLQIKATSRPQMRPARASVAVRVERKHLVSWLEEQYPVILVLYDASADQAYWLHVQQELGRGQVFALPRESNKLTVHMKLAQVVNEEAVRQWRRHKSRAWAAWRRGLGHA